MQQKFIKDPWSTYTKNQIDAKFIFSIFRQTPLRVSGVFTTHLYGVPPDDVL